MLKQKDNNTNSKILKFTTIFTMIYALLPVIFFDLVQEHIVLFYVFFPPAIIWYGIIWFESDVDLAFSYYVIFIAIFWIINFAIIKLAVSVYKKIKR